MEFTEDPFKDYRYEDPFNIDDPFADLADGPARPGTAAGFETDFFAGANGTFAHSGRASAPPAPAAPAAPADPFAANNNDSWAAWPNDNWTADAWPAPAPVPSAPAPSAPAADTWAADFTDHNKNLTLNETWPAATLPSKKEKSPKPVKIAKGLVHTIGGIARARHNKDKKKAASAEAVSAGAPGLPSEEQQWAWAAAESRRAQAEAERRRRQEDAELQLALAISRQEK